MRIQMTRNLEISPVLQPSNLASPLGIDSKTHQGVAFRVASWGKRHAPHDPRDAGICASPHSSIGGPRSAPVVPHQLVLLSTAESLKDKTGLKRPCGPHTVLGL